MFLATPSVDMSTVGDCVHRAPLVKGTVSPLREVPASIKRPSYVGKKDPPYSDSYQKHDEQVQLLRYGRRPQMAAALCKSHSSSALLVWSLTPSSLPSREYSRWRRQGGWQRRCSRRQGAS